MTTHFGLPCRDGVAFFDAAIQATDNAPIIVYLNVND